MKAWSLELRLHVLHRATFSCMYHNFSTGRLGPPAHTGKKRQICAHFDAMSIPGGPSTEKPIHTRLPVAFATKIDATMLDRLANPYARQRQTQRIA